MMWCLLGVLTWALSQVAERRGRRGPEGGPIVAQDHRARQYASTHQRIYDAAMELFARHGYEDVSIAWLAAAAGVSVQTFYAHYPGKDELLMALPERGEKGNPAATVVVTAHLSAYTQALLRWAETDGELALEDVVQEALDALHEL